MASAKEVMKDDKHRVNMTLNAIITLSMILAGQALNAWFVSERDEGIDLDLKADKIEVVELSKKVELKADKSFVKEAIQTHEGKEAEMMLRLEQLITLSIENQSNGIKQIDRRLSRMEMKLD